MNQQNGLELTELFDIFFLRRWLFLLLFITPVFVAMVVLATADDLYETSLTIVTAREYTGIPTVEEVSANTENYDSFYRLSADEKFQTSLSEWVKSPAVAESVLRRADGTGYESFSLGELEEYFKTSQKSTNVMTVSYKSPTNEQASEIAEILTQDLQSFSESISQLPSDNSWFQSKAEAPVIRLVEKKIFFYMILSAIIGSALGVLGTISREYYVDQKTRKAK